MDSLPRLPFFVCKRMDHGVESRVDGEEKRVIQVEITLKTSETRQIKVDKVDKVDEADDTLDKVSLAAADGTTGLFFLQ